MGINYKYDLDTVGGGWYLYELDIVPEYIEPLDPNMDGEDGHAWGIFDRHGRMSDFRIAVGRWNPGHVGFVDGYIIDKTHDKYWGGHLGEEDFIIDKDDHRWPCFVIDLQLVYAMSMLWDRFDSLSFDPGGDRDGRFSFSLGDTASLRKVGLRYYLPDLGFCVEYMTKHEIPSDHYRGMMHRLVESMRVKRELGIEYGNLGGGYGGRVIQLEGRTRKDCPHCETLDMIISAGMKSYGGIIKGE